MSKIDTSNFQKLIGTWRTTGQVSQGGNVLKLEGTDIYEFILQGNYILHKAEVQIGSERSETLEVISPDNVPGKARMQYFNAKGESGTMTAMLDQGNFQIDGDGIRFRGTINSTNTVIIGKWFLQTENKDWSEFITLKLERQL